MVESDRGPRRRDMAIIAGVGGPDVRRRLAALLHIVMAGKAGGPGLRMIKGNGRPVGDDMAGSTIVGRRQMCCRLACRPPAIMAIDAIPERSSVIEMHNLPRRGDVARLAVRRGWNVIGRTARGTAIVVTRETAGGDAGMIEGGDIPSRRHMAGLAGVAGRTVVEGLAGCVQPVMAGDAGAFDFDVIKLWNGPGGRLVTIGTVIAGPDVKLTLSCRGVAIVTAEAS